MTERTAELEGAKLRAESADRVKSAFLATMSHELRTPLNSIIGFTGILLQRLPGPLNAEQEKQLAIVKNAGRHLLALISDVLDISKVEAGELRLAHERFDLSALLARLGAAFATEAAHRGRTRISRAAPMTQVLMVEDREESRHLPRSLLEGRGYRVSVAGDGLEAFAAARIRATTHRRPLHARKAPRTRRHCRSRQPARVEMRPL